MKDIMQAEMRFYTDGTLNPIEVDELRAKIYSFLGITSKRNKNVEVRVTNLSCSDQTLIEVRL